MSPTGQDATGEWTPTNWWRVTAPDGSIWCETSVESEAREAMRPEDSLSRLFELTKTRWIEQMGGTPSGGEQAHGGPVAGSSRSAADGIV